MFYIAQICGLVALIILTISFQKNDKDKLLKLQIFSSLFFMLQYLFLGATTGCLMNLITMIRNFVFKQFKNKIPIIYLLIIITIMLILSAVSYNGVISVLPVIAAVLYTLAIYQTNLTITRIIEIVTCLLFMIYNIKVLAIAGLISTIVEMTFAFVSIYRYDLKHIKLK